MGQCLAKISSIPKVSCCALGNTDLVFPLESYIDNASAVAPFGSHLVDIDFGTSR